MNATVILKYQEKKQMVAIPSSAIVFDKSKNWVMVFNDKSNIETRQVEVYKSLTGVSYLSSGIRAGEEVISQNALPIYDELNDK